MNIILTAVAKVSKDNKFLGIFIICYLFLIWISIFIPAQIIPGNDFVFQLSLMKTKDWLLLIPAALMTSLLFVFYLFIFKKRRQENLEKNLSESGVGAITGIFALIFATFTCVACALPLLGFFSFGTAVFLASYRLPITILAIIILGISLHLVSKKVLGICEICQI